MPDSVLSKRPKPRLRGRIHQFAFFVSIVACAVLLFKARDHRAWVAALIYTGGLLSLFGTSALYHRIYWAPRPRALLKRLDHSAIFLLIAGTSTPLAMLALPKDNSPQVLMIIWAIAGVGILKSIFWPQAPRRITSALYVAAGWSMFPYLPLFRQSLSLESLYCILAGGLVYTIGAVGYAIKRPVLNPLVFGYHEMFHLMTVIAATFQFIAIASVIV